jgi:hypothetical protein
MSDNVVKLDMLTKVDLAPDSVLNAATDKLSEVLVLGWEKAEDGDGEFYFAASDADLSRALMLLHRAQRDIMERMR